MHTCIKSEKISFLNPKFVLSTFFLAFLISNFSFPLGHYMELASCKSKFDISFYSWMWGDTLGKDVSLWLVGIHRFRILLVASLETFRETVPLHQPFTGWCLATSLRWFNQAALHVRVGRKIKGCVINFYGQKYGRAIRKDCTFYGGKKKKWINKTKTFIKNQTNLGAIFCYPYRQIQ